jgi:hypothetical protein
MKEEMIKWSMVTVTSQKKVALVEGKLLQLQTQHPGIQDHQLEDQLTKECEEVEQELYEY